MTIYSFKELQLLTQALTLHLTSALSACMFLNTYSYALLNPSCRLAVESLLNRDGREKKTEATESRKTAKEKRGIRETVGPHKPESAGRNKKRPPGSSLAIFKWPFPVMYGLFGVTWGER